MTIAAEIAPRASDRVAGPPRAVLLVGIVVAGIAASAWLGGAGPRAASVC